MMRWGVGTGRCGTRSLAEQLGGIHEPSPGLVGPRVKQLEILRGRLSKGLPSVDRLQSFAIPLIAQVDPSAHVLWLARDPWGCVPSMLQTAHEGIQTLEESCDYWLNTNRKILCAVTAPTSAPKSYEIIYTWQLEKHCGRTKAEHARNLDPEEYLYVTKFCSGLWEVIGPDGNKKLRRRKV